MKITIDTKEDSHEEIRRAIKMLSSLIGERIFSNQPNIFEDNDNESEPSNAFANMFGSGSTQSEELSDEEAKAEEKEEIPEIIEYD